MLPGDELKDMEARLKALEGALANLEARTVRMSVSLSVSVGLSCLSVSLSLSLSQREGLLAVDFEHIICLCNLRLKIRVQTE